jgi:hypothetical protein
MKKSLIALVALAVMLTANSASNDHHVRADLVAPDGSHVRGFVQVTQLGKGGAEITVVAEGLDPGVQYSSFYYESADCTEPADLLGNFTDGDDGHGEVHGTIDDDLDEVGSVSVRLGPGYGTLEACAKIH